MWEAKSSGDEFCAGVERWLIPFGRPDILRYLALPFGYRFFIEPNKFEAWIDEKVKMRKTTLLTWYYEFSKANFRNFNELKAVYGNASIVANGRVILNIKGNDFRLVTSVNFRQLAAYVIWFGTHKEYDKIDTSKVSFDIEILNFKSK